MRLAVFLYSLLLPLIICFDVVAKNILYHLPDEFADYYYDVPLAARMEVDSEYLGDVLIIYSRQHTIRVIELVDSQQSDLTPVEIKKWLAVLAQEQKLGLCSPVCKDLITAIEFNTMNSVLSVMTGARRNKLPDYTLPENPGRGMINTNNLAFSFSGREYYSGSLFVDVLGSANNWTYKTNYLLSKDSEQKNVRHYLYEFYGARELQQQTLLLGVVNPAFGGVSRIPASSLLSGGALLGMQVSSSSHLNKSQGAGAMRPVYLSVGQQGVAEIWRNNNLLYTQTVTPGLQLIDTDKLPTGIYEVEVRLLDNARVVHTQRELIYKPRYWADSASLWQYDVYAGRRAEKLQGKYAEENAWMFGSVLNGLIRPNLILGLQYNYQNENSAATSLEWMLSDHVTLFTSGYVSDAGKAGMEIESHASFNYLVATLNYNMSYYNSSAFSNYGADIYRQNNIAVNFSYLFPDGASLSSRTAWTDTYASALSQDLSLRFSGSAFDRGRLQWRLGMFSRPSGYRADARRNRGADIALTWYFDNGKNQNFQGDIRTGRVSGRQSGTEGSVSMTQYFPHHTVNSVSSSLSMNAHSVGYGLATNLASERLRGNAFFNDQSGYGHANGGGNFEFSTVATPGQALPAIIPVSSASIWQAGGILEVESEADNIRILTDSGAELNKGVNYISLEPWRNNTLKFSIHRDSPVVGKIIPAAIEYNLNKGEVLREKITVVPTFDVLGRLSSPSGVPLKGMRVKSSVAEAWTDHDGAFLLEMTRSASHLMVGEEIAPVCQHDIDVERNIPVIDGIMIIGNLLCTGS